MPRARPGADPQYFGRNNRKSQPSPATAPHRSSDRLHLALAVALGAVSLVAIALPLRRASASAEEVSGAPVLVVADGFSATVQAQAQTVVSALAQAGAAPTPQDPALSQGIEAFPGADLVPRPLLVAAADLLVRGALAGPEGQQGLTMELQRPVRFTLHEGKFPSVVFSTRPSVGAALAALGADYGPADLVSPTPDTPLTAGLHVFVQRATEVRLSIGGEAPVAVYTHAETVADLLAEREVDLSDGDRVRPGLSSRIREGLVIAVTVVREERDVVETPIPFKTIYRDDPDLEQGQSAVLQLGADGLVRQEYAVVYENGQEVSRELVSEKITPPTHHIILLGTAAPAPPPPVAVAAVVSPPGGDPDCAWTLTVWATWYTAASAGGSGTTATGTTVTKGSVAVDPSVIPLGTRMFVPGYGYGVAEDTGGAVVGNIIDLGYGADDVKDWTSRYVDICILG